VSNRGLAIGAAGRVVSAGQAELRGNLEIHGQARPLTLRADVSNNGDSLSFSSEVDIDRRDWGMSHAAQVRFSTKIHLTFFGGSPAVYGREEADPVLGSAERAALVWPLLLFDVALDDSQRSAFRRRRRGRTGARHARPTGISRSRWGTAGAAGEGICL
jgi:YceI-like domain